MAEEQHLISRTCIADGVACTGDKPIPLASGIIFSTYDEGIVGHWTVSAKSADGEDTVLSEDAEMELSNTYILDTSSIELINLRLDEFYRSDKKHPEGDYSEHGYVFTVHFVSSSGENDQMDFMFCVAPRLAPGKPVITNPHFLFENYDWENDSMIFNTPVSEFTFEVFSENATSFEVNLIYDEGGYNYFSIDDWYNDDVQSIDCVYFDGWGEISDGRATYLSTKILGESGQDWGEVIFIRGINEYGRSVYSEPIFTSDYITDPAILDRIEELQASVGIDVPKEGMKIIHIGREVSAVSDGDATVTLEVVGIDGAKRVAATGRGTVSADLSGLAPGLYVVRASDGESVKTVKIVT